MVAEEEQKLGNLSSAITAYKQSNVWSKKLGKLNVITSNYLEIAELYFRLGNKDQALIYLRLYSLLQEFVSKSDLKYITSRLNNLHLLETKALEEQLSTRQTEISILEKQISNATGLSIWLGVFLALAIFSLLVVGYLYYKTISGLGTDKKNQMNMLQHEFKNKLEKAKNESLESRFQKEESETLVKYLQSDNTDHDSKFFQDFPNSFKLQISKDKIGGDFLWTHSTKETSLICLGDCGYGLSGAIVSRTVQDILSHVVNETGISSPSMILTLVDQSIEQKLNPLKLAEFPGVGLAVLHFNKKSREADICSSSVIVYRANVGKIEQLTTNKLLLGNPNFKEKFFEANSFKLKPKDILFMSTDGFQNQIGGARRQKFSRKALAKLLQSTIQQKNTEQIYIIEKVLKEWRRSEPQTDDITILGIKPV